jgi:hypothetical protein
MIVVSDEHYQPSIRKLAQAKFHQALPTRGPPPELAAMMPHIKKVREEINAGYRNLDQSTTWFDYPAIYDCTDQVVLAPSSYAHLSVSTITPITSAGSLTDHGYDVYGNLFYPLERTLLESFIKVILREGDDIVISLWVNSLRACIAHMVGYLEVNNDAVDECPDKEVVEWYSHNFGRKRELRLGPWDRRISKRIGSGREMPVDMRGHPVGDNHGLDTAEVALVRDLITSENADTVANAPRVSNRVVT